MTLILKDYTDLGFGSASESDAFLKDALPVYGSLFFQPVLSATDPFFATSFNIPLAAQPQGTWVKVTGLTTGINNGITVVSDNLRVDTDGIYEVSLSGGVVAQNDGSNRTIGFGFMVNGGAATQPIGNVQFHGGNFGISNDRPLPFNGSKIFSLSQNDTLSLYFVGVRDSGTAAVDLTCSYINFSIKRLNGAFSLGEV